MALSLQNSVSLVLACFGADSQWFFWEQKSSGSIPWLLSWKGCVICIASWALSGTGRLLQSNTAPLIFLSVCDNSPLWDTANNCFSHTALPSLPAGLSVGSWPFDVLPTWHWIPGSWSTTTQELKLGFFQSIHLWGWLVHLKPAPKTLLFQLILCEKRKKSKALSGDS